jgi:hypothetical protein
MDPDLPHCGLSIPAEERYQPACQFITSFDDIQRGPLRTCSRAQQLRVVCSATTQGGKGEQDSSQQDAARVCKSKEYWEIWVKEVNINEVDRRGY